MAGQRTEGEIDGVEVMVYTRGPEAQEDPDGIGSDVLHSKITRAINDIKQEVEADGAVIGGNDAER